MSDIHLAAGSVCPPRDANKLRLYSMKFCPFCQRARLVLEAKGVPYDVVNINLKNKPHWMFHLHSDGKVPILNTGDRVVIESLEVADFLDEKYPNPPLYPADPEQKTRDKKLIEKYGEVVGATTAAIYNKDNKPIDTFMSSIVDPLEEFEVELSCRGTTFFGGAEPGMVDYMMWPWAERSKVPSAMRNEELHFPRDRFPKLVAWKMAMHDVKAVKETFIDVDTHVKFLRGYFGDNPVFDNL